MVKELVVYPDDRIIMCGPVRSFKDPSLPKLLEDMKETMEAHNLNALSAIQVAHPFNIVVIKQKDGSYLELINPSIIQKEGRFESIETTSYYPGITFKIPRFEKIKVLFEDRNGNMKSMTIEDKELSATIQRKLDYLSGATPLYRLDQNQRDRVIQALKDKGVYRPEEVCPLFSKKDYITSFNSKLLFFMGLTLFAPLLKNYSPWIKNHIQSFWQFDKFAYILSWILMIVYFFYAQYEAKKYRQCTSCQIGNQIGVIGKHLLIATAIFLGALFFLKP